MATEKHEIVCITRCGFNFLHGERIDLAAKVTYQSYLKEGHKTYGGTILQELFIPRYDGPFGKYAETL